MKSTLLLLTLLCSSLLADTESGNTGLKFENIYLYAAQGTDNNLREMPGDIIGLDLPTEDTYLYAIGSFLPFQLSSLEEYDHLQLGLTSVLVTHSGMQSHAELDAALTLKYKELLSENSYLNLDLAFGIGLSYAFDTPTYEDPVISDDGTIEYYQLQSYLHFDAEIYTPSIESLHLLLRVHHRSGIYGLFAPSGVGSNFIGAGLVYYFNK